MKAQARKKSDGDDEQTPDESEASSVIAEDHIAEDTLLTTTKLEHILTEQCKEHTAVLMVRIDSLFDEPLSSLRPIKKGSNS